MSILNISSTCDCGSIPSGIIVIWNGSKDSIPNGWVLCDGENSTPDLQNKFIADSGGIYYIMKL